MLKSLLLLSPLWKLSPCSLMRGVLRRLSLCSLMRGVLRRLRLLLPSLNPSPSLSPSLLRANLSRALKRSSPSLESLR